MPTQYAGVASNVPAFAAPIAISATVIGPPCLIRTVGPHGLVTGQLVDITGETVATTINGIWIVTVTDPTHFTITPAGGSNASPVSFVQPITFPTVQIISDGDNLQAGNLNPVGQASQDQLAFLLFATGKYKVADYVKVTRDFSGIGTSYGTIPTTLANTFYASTMGFETSINDVQANDIVEVDIAVNVSGPTAAKLYALAVYRSNTTPGAASAPVRIAGAGKTWTQVTANYIKPVNMKAYYQVLTTGVCQIAIYGLTNNAGDTITLYDDETVVAKLWRPTTVPQ